MQLSVVDNERHTNEHRAESFAEQIRGRLFRFTLSNKNGDIPDLAY